MVQRFFGFLLPGLLNSGLALWIVWHLVTTASYARGMGFGAFVWLYAIGGLAIVLFLCQCLYVAGDRRIRQHGRRPAPPVVDDGAHQYYDPERADVAFAGAQLTR
jgi:hypothetical protein